MSKFKIFRLELEVTERCNMRCKHCYMGEPVDSDMSYELLINLLDEAHDPGVYDVILSGGEPLLRKDIFEIIHYVKRNFSYKVGLLTNGSLIDDSNVKKLTICDYIQLSLDSPPDVECPVRGGRISRETIRVAKMLKRYGIHVTFFSTLSKLNWRYVDALVKIAEDLEIPISFARMVPVGRGSSIKDMMFNPYEYYMLMKKIVELKRKSRFIYITDPLRVLLDESQWKGRRESIIGGCAAGVISCTITTTGEVFPCPLLRISAGNIIKNNLNLKDIWLESPIFKLLRSRKFMACTECSYRFTCGGCRATAYSIFKNIYAKDPLCFKHLIC